MSVGCADRSPKPYQSGSNPGTHAKDWVARVSLIGDPRLKGKSAQQKGKQMPIDFTRIPSSLHEAMIQCTENLNEEEVGFIKENGTIILHHDLGMQMRNAWGLWDAKSPLHQFFKKEFGLGHADDMSGMILSCVEAKVNGEAFNPYKQAEKYKKHWIDMGIDPLTQKEFGCLS